MSKGWAMLGENQNIFTCKQKFLGERKVSLDFYFYMCYNGITTIWRVVKMAVSYKKLWKLLIDKDMKKEELRIAAGISTNTMAKLGKNENVNTEMLVKICSALKCDIADIMEIVEND